jgi:flagellar biosynthesis/type III secretory pathway M-ring protein FliF/YscJ
MIKIPTIQEIEASIGGRPKQQSIKVRQLVYLDREEKQQLNEMAKERRTSVSGLLRQWIHEQLNR